MCVQKRGGGVCLVHAPDAYAAEEVVAGTGLECDASERELTEGSDVIAGLIDDCFEEIYREVGSMLHRVSHRYVWVVG